MGIRDSRSFSPRMDEREKREKREAWGIDGFWHCVTVQNSDFGLEEERGFRERPCKGASAVTFHQKEKNELQLAARSHST